MPEKINKKYKNKIKSSKYYSKSCSNKIDKFKDNLENYNIEITKIKKNLKQGIKKEINNQLLEIENK